MLSAPLMRSCLSVFPAYENQPWKSFCSSNAEQKTSQLFTNRTSIILSLLLSPHQLCILYIKYLTFAHPLICIISQRPSWQKSQGERVMPLNSVVSFTSVLLVLKEYACVQHLCCRQSIWRVPWCIGFDAFKPTRKHNDINNSNKHLKYGTITRIILTRVSCSKTVAFHATSDSSFIAVKLPFQNETVLRP